VACPRSEDHLEKLLISLPHSLDETYERMLNNIDITSVEYAKRILMWLCFAKRPMRVREVIDGVVVELGDNPKLNFKRRLQDEYDILQICPGFIEVSLDRRDKTARTLRIAHYSVQEYLESDRIRQQAGAIYSMQSTISHVEAAQICLIYLFHVTNSDSRLTEATLNAFPLAQYSAEYWYEHYKNCEEAATQVDPFVMQLFGGQPNAFKNWIRIHNPEDFLSYNAFEKRSDDIMSPVYCASLLGLNFVLRGLLQLKKEESAQKSDLRRLSSSGIAGLVNVQSGRYGNALQAASTRGHEQIVQLLLDRGAEVNAQGAYYGNALQAASGQGHEQIVQLLLNQGAEINERGGEYGNALQAASTRGHQQSIQLFLDRGADVNAQGGYYGNALQAASIRGHEQVIRLLLNEGAEIDAQGGKYDNALQAASIAGQEQIVQLLLDRGAEINTQGGFYGNALQAASTEGHEQIVQLLLKQGADVNAQGGQYGNALQAASKQGDKQTLQLLLDRGAEVNAQGGYYGNALQAASTRGYEQIVQLLLDRAAEVNAQGGYYGNALQAASEEGHEQIVKLLLDQGGEVNAQDGEYGNALQAASKRGHEQVVQLLLDRGAEFMV
jgi:ankyrin repeat protein